MNDKLRGLIMAAIGSTMPALVAVGVVNWSGQQLAVVTLAVTNIVLLAAYFLPAGQGE